ncbi:MAG: hypothetical protein M3347_00985 [Armatimonadota bacterium]|nr:hypothetical protein [Armatimonadota bacterium]
MTQHRRRIPRRVWPLLVVIVALAWRAGTGQNGARAERAIVYGKVGLETLAFLNRHLKP